MDVSFESFWLILVRDIAGWEGIPSWFPFRENYKCCSFQVRLAKEQVVSGYIYRVGFVRASKQLGSSEGTRIC